MTSVNKAILIGRLGADPKVSGTAVKLNIATSEKIKDKNGMPIEKTEWHNVTLFTKLAEIAQKYLTKGSLVYIEGKFQTSKWQDKDGKDRYTTEIIGNSLQMLGGSKNNLDAQQKQPQSNDNAQVTSYDYMHMKNAAKKQSIEDDLSDLPF